MTTIPTLTTDRLILRAPRLADFDAWADYFTSPRSVFEGGPFDRVQAYRIWASDVALWQLRGYGPFAVEDRDTGVHLGDVGLYQSAGYPAAELGWFTVPQAEGKGIAFEAAQRVLGWLRDTTDWPHVTNIIHPDNDRSIALGLRLGGVIDPSLPGIDQEDVVIRHDLKGAPT